MAKVDVSIERVKDAHLLPVIRVPGTGNMTVTVHFGYPPSTPPLEAMYQRIAELQTREDVAEREAIYRAQVFVARDSPEES